MQDKALDVAALGEAMVEFNQTTAGQPQFLQGFGGDTSNVAIAAARAGARSAYLTRIGGDTFGHLLLQLWAQEGVNTSGVTTASASHTGIYFVTHGPKGHEFSYRRADSAASRMTPQWLGGAPSDIIRAARFLQVSGISLAISAGACDTAFEAMQLAVGKPDGLHAREPCQRPCEARRGILSAGKKHKGCVILTSFAHGIALSIRTPARQLSQGSGCGIEGKISSILR